MTRHSANFDRVARPYRVLEYLTMGRVLERTRFHFLDRLVDGRQALVLGDGDGRFLERLLRANPSVRATAVDSSGEMLRLLRARCEAHEDRLQTVHTNVVNFVGEGDEVYDLVATHFLLDCLSHDEVTGLVERLRPQLRTGALWVVSEFRVPRGAMNLPSRLLIKALYLAFRLLTGLRQNELPDYSRALAQAGFKPVEQRLFLAGVLSAELWRFAKP